MSRRRSSKLFSRRASKRSGHKKSIRALDARGRAVVFKSGDKVKLASGKTDTIRTCFVQDYTTGRSEEACTLRNHSWAPTSEMTRVATKTGRKLRR